MTAQYTIHSDLKDDKEGRKIQQMVAPDQRKLLFFRGMQHTLSARGLIEADDPGIPLHS